MNKSRGDKSILVINAKGVFRVYCPFKVQCIKAIDVFTIGETAMVISVSFQDQKPVYTINGNEYYYSFFKILFSPKPTRLRPC